MTFRRMVFYIVMLVVVLIVAYSIVNNRSNKTSTTPHVTPPTVISTAHYACDNGATIDASFTNNSTTIALSDSRHFVLPQTISADGAQYQQGTVLFVTKGDQAFLQENNATTYSNCLAGIATAPSSGVNTFTDQGKTFTFTYPSTFTLAGGGIGYTQSWKTDSDATLGLILATINVPQSYQSNTNFGDAKFTVGTSSDPKAVASCLKPTSGMAATKSSATINGVSYTVLTFRDAAAGNRYDTTSYRTVRNHQCYAIDYTIHYGAIENYDPSMGVKAFDEKSVQNALDAIMQSFKFL